MRRFTLTVVALLGAALAITPAALASGSPKAKAAAFHFTGKTSQNLPLELLLAGSGRKVAEHVQYQVSCTSGLSFPDEETVSANTALVYKSGHHISRAKWDASGSGQITTTDPQGRSLTGTLTLHITGKIRFDTGNANGRVEADILLSNGDKCTSGNTPVTWSASVD